MYQEFAITSIDTEIQNKRIIIKANKAINKNIENIVIDIYERDTKTPVLFDYCIDIDKVIIKLKEWPIPNTDYILGVTGITSILDETLDANIKKRIKFTSNVISKVKITSPVMFEEIKDLDIVLVEDIENKTNSYYIEVAKDNSFFNITNKVIVNKEFIRLDLKDKGQHFIRARVQTDDSNYSKWSSTISFIYGNSNISIPNCNTDKDICEDVEIDTDFGDQDLPELDLSDPFIITEYPEQGITPEEGLLIAFNNYINDMSLDNIIVTRKEVK